VIPGTSARPRPPTHRGDDRPLPHHPVHRPGHEPACEEDQESFTGRVTEVVFDCFGDFIGFVLDDCCEHCAFASREREIGELVMRALKERLTLMAVTSGKERRIVRLVVKG
jgi:hypothetical protein